MSDPTRDGKSPEPVPLSRFRAALARPAGKKRIDALLSATDAVAQVEALSVPDLYFLVKDVGVTDSYELLALATPEQIQGCLDLDSWDRDHPQLEGIKPWLAAIADGGFERLARVWRGLDPELCALLLARWTKIWDHSLGEAPDDEEDGALYQTPDTFFTLKVVSDREDDVTMILSLIEDLYRGDADLARHTIMAARSEPVTELEEYAYRWRSGRMADLGYVDFYDALEVFRPLDPETVLIGEGTADVVRGPADEAPGASTLPVRMVEQVVGRAFLARALDGVRDPVEAERLETALLVLVNKVLAAARVSPGDEEAIIVGTEHATATVSLGLESVSGGDLARATQALASVSLGRLHRVGYTMTLRLARLARSLAGKAACAGSTTSDVLAAVLRARPFFPLVLDNPPGEGVRPFESSMDVQRVAAHLAELAFRLAIAERLGIDVHALADVDGDHELDDYLRTALVRGVVDRELSSAPLDGDEIDAALRTAFADGALTEQARTAAARRLAETLADVPTGREYLPRLVQRWLSEIEEDLGGLTPGAPIDPHYIGRIVTRADKS